MAVNMDEFVRIVENIAPKTLAYDWDNSGLLLRCGDTVSRVLIALDATAAVVNEAAAKGCDMILAHHPLIFKPFQSLDCRKAQDGALMALIRRGISLYAAHTTFDRAADGINDALAQRLGLCRVIAATGEGEMLMRVGDLVPPLGRNDFLESVKAALGVEAVRVSATECGIVSRVAAAGGSGGDFVAAAINEGAQALVTGEAKHHHFIEAAAQGLLLVEAGHFHTECVFAQRLYMSLQSSINELQLDLSLMMAENDKAPYTLY